MVRILQRLLPFKLKIEGNAESVTAYGGLPLIVEALRAVASKRWYRGLAEALRYKSFRTVRRHVESLVALFAAGGDCLEDLRMMRADQGLSKLLGYVPSSATQAKDFLYRFHQNAQGLAWTEAEDRELSQTGRAQVREEGPGLRKLEELLSEIVEQIQKHQGRTSATLDVDATIIEAQKKSALRAYEGTVGYQPQLAWWAEQQVWVTDEFRDGNVPAAFEARRFLQRAFGRLPTSVNRRRLRSDSALYDEEALSWADEHGIEFAVSADMSAALASHVRQIVDSEWKPYRSLRGEGIAENAHEERQWADVMDFIPNWGRNFKNGTAPLRYIAIRVRPRQRELWENQIGWRHFAIVTNMAWDGERLLRWHREKQGTVEHAHGVLKNELAAGTLPSGRYGTNAAFLRLNVITQNLLQFTKVLALPPEMATLRPKALRFRLLHIAGRVIRHAGATWLELSAKNPVAKIYSAAREIFVALARASPSSA